MTAATEGSSATEQAKSTAQEGAQQVREKAQEGAQQARSRVRDEVDRRSTQAGEQVRGTADAIRGASSQLREQGNEQGARAVEQAASRMESAGSWLRDSDGDRILRDVEDFGRRNSLVVMAGGLAIGFAASRLLKASSRRRYESSSRPSAPYSGNGATTGQVTPDSTVGATTGTVPTDPGASPRTSVPPREGLTEAGLSGGTPATSPPSWQGGLGGEGEGHRGP
jgi:hypothetical protein